MTSSKLKRTIAVAGTLGFTHYDHHKGTLIPSEERVYRTRRSPTTGAAAQTTCVRWFRNSSTGTPSTSRLLTDIPARASAWRSSKPLCHADSQVTRIEAQKLRLCGQERWYTAVGVYAKASQELLKGPPERSKQINDAYEVARREFEDSRRLLEEHQKEHGCHRSRYGSWRNLMTN